MATVGCHGKVLRTRPAPRHAILTTATSLLTRTSNHWVLHSDVPVMAIHLEHGPTLTYPSPGVHPGCSLGLGRTQLCAHLFMVFHLHAHVMHHLNPLAGSQARSSTLESIHTGLLFRSDTFQPLAGLLPAAADPLAAVLDADLRAELMRCGHFAAACPDAFQGDVSSLRLGTCIYPWTQLAIGQQDAEMNKVQMPTGT